MPVLMLAASVLQQPVEAQDVVFEDDFRSGDLCFWAAATGVDLSDCPDCTPASCTNGCCVDDNCVTGLDCDTCASFGKACSGDLECCSANCEDGFCGVSAGSCRRAGSQCSADAECCSSSCDVNVDGVERCSRPSQCKPLGDACARASDCCSLFCDPQMQCSSTATCSPLGSACSSDVECCSDSCVGNLCVAESACDSLGETCSTDSECCSRICTGGRCNFHYYCRAAEEPCSTDTDCCTGVCDSGTQRCADVAGCLTSGEPAPVLQACCTRTIGETALVGANHCVRLGGCSVVGELCSRDLDCCSEACEPDGDVSRCANVVGCNPGGEICGAGASNNCCDPDNPPNGGSEFCFDFERHDFPRCTTWVPTGPEDLCLDAGEECKIADRCCSLRCLPSDTSSTGFRCADACLDAGEGSCTIDTDCCPGTLCQHGECVSGGPVCTHLGGRCVFTSDCCTGDCNQGFCSG